MARPNAHKLPKYLRRKANGTYFIDCYVTLEDGTRERRLKTLGVMPRKLAEEVHLKFMGELATGKFMKRRISFAEAADSFLEYSRSRKRSHESDVPKVRFFKDYFGSMKLQSLNGDMVEKMLNQLKVKGPMGKPLQPASLNLYIATLKTIVNRALDNGHLDRNPIKGVKLFKVNNARDRTLTRAEFERLIAGCTDYLRPMVILAYFTGMRRGEILGLRWDQVDFGKSRIMLSPEDTKTNEARQVPLDADLQELLRRQPRALHCPNVFTHRGRPIGDLKTAFHGACRRAGIEDFRFHDLRHCAVTNMRKAGVDPHVIMSVSGHKTLYMLHRYDKVDGGDRLEALGRVRDKFDNVGGPETKTA